MSRIAVVLMIVLSLAACGRKGPLLLPPGPAPEPLLGNPKPAPAVAGQPGPDVSTAPEAKKP